MKINTHRELRVWQDAMDSAMEIFSLTKSFPAEEKYSLIDQIRRSSRSVATNIAEAWRKRRYEAAFISKLNDAESEGSETQTWLDFAVRCGYLSPSTAKRLDMSYDKILGQIVNMIQNPGVWILTKSTASPPVPLSPSRLVRKAVSAALMIAATATTASDWPQWRGPSRDGHPAAGSAPVASLPKEMKPVWKLPIGPGFSAPVVAGGKLIYLDELDGKEVVHCLTALSGKEIWRTPFADSAGDEWGSGPRSTPFIDGDRVYAQSMNGEFECLNLADGKPLWSTAFQSYGISFSTKTAEGTASRRGNNGSGIVEGDFVYVPVGAKGASIVCFDKLTGKEIWKTGSDEAAYSSFVVATFSGTKQLVAFTADALTGLDLKTGRQLWRVPFKTGAKRHAATPVINGDTVTVNSQTIGLVCTRISKSGDSWTTTPVWTNKPLTINLATPVLVDGHFYCYGAIRTKDYVCVNATTGQLKWTQGGFGIGKDQTDYASTIAVGKNLLVLTYDGQLVLIAADPEKYTELARVQVCGKTWSHPALADGRLYVRDGKDLQCFVLDAKPLAAR